MNHNGHPGMLPVVIVDDSHEDALLAQRALAQCKVQNPVILLNSGHACLDYFQGIAPYSKRSLPCLLLLDMMMAPLSGLDVLRQLESLPAARGSILVMISGLAGWRVINEGYRLGAHTFLLKPLAVEDVMQMLNSIPSLAVSQVTDGYEISIAGKPSLSGRQPPSSTGLNIPA
jgi:CheY-like chemotaxis protein